MKHFRLVLVCLLGATLLSSSAAAQARVDRFEPVTWRPNPKISLEIDLALGADLPIAESADRGWIVVGALAGLAIGATAGYLLYQDHTAGCDDGICGWVPPMIIGGASGLVLGGFIGWGIIAEPERPPAARFAPAYSRETTRACPTTSLRTACPL